MASTLVFEHSYYIGNYLSGILYGIALVLYFNILKCCGRFPKGDKLLVFYSTALTILLTIDIATNAFWGQQMWISSRNLPGGPPMFIAQNLSVWYQILGSSTAAALILLGDALLIYRCYILWGSDYKIIILPVLVYLAAFALAIVELVGAYSPGGNFFGGRALVFGTTYYAISIGLNIVLTLLICGRLVYFSRLMRTTFGRDHSSARLYTGVASMIAESAAVYTAVGIMFLIPYAMQSQTSNLFGQLYAKFAYLSPQLIVLRVAQGRTWGKDTVKNAQTSTSFEWSPRRTEGTSTGTHLTELPHSATQIDMSKITSKGSYRKYDHDESSSVQREL